MFYEHRCCPSKCNKSHNWSDTLNRARRRQNRQKSNKSKEDDYELYLSGQSDMVILHVLDIFSNDTHFVDIIPSSNDSQS